MSAAMSATTSAVASATTSAAASATTSAAASAIAGVLFLEYPKCSTCQKAKKWLDAHGVEYVDRHIVEDNPTADELRIWWQASDLPLRRFFNTSGMLYRELNVKAQLNAGMTDDEVLELLATNGMLVKRPLVVVFDGDGSDGVGDGAGGADGRSIARVLVGFKEPEWEAALA